MLKDELKKVRDLTQQQAPDALKAMDQSTADLRAAKVLQQGPKIGDRVENFMLTDAVGKRVELSRLLASGPVVLTFYRGGWCPYCNLQLAALQKSLPDFNAVGGQLVAISPESPDNSLSTIEKHKIAFTVLSDNDNTIARRFGIIYKVPPYLNKVYEGFGVDLRKHNATDSLELPIPATYVIDQQGIIRYAFANEDFTVRPEVTEILKALQNLKQLA